jgi:hypothetical protein
VLPNDKLEEIPATDDLYRQPFDLAAKPPQGTKAYVDAFGERWAPLLGVRRDGRWIVVYSPVDLCSDVSEGLHDTVVGYRRESGAPLSVNVLYQALRP